MGAAGRLPAPPLTERAASEPPLRRGFFPAGGRPAHRYEDCVDAESAIGGDVAAKPSQIPERNVLKSLVYDRLRVITRPALRRWIKGQSWFVPVSRALFGTAVYSESYFRDVERIEATSMPHVADWVRQTLAPRRVVDVGCGPGHLLAAIRRHDIEGVGLDVSTAALKAARAKGLDARFLDLTVPAEALPGVPYDLAISCEVAEHLDERFAANFVRLIAGAAPIAYVTAFAPDPLEGVGLHHVNEQPNQYWIELFERHGMALDAQLTESARRRLDRPDVATYLRRPMVFRRGP
jgi:SAM-dependent methyltransferase